MEISQPNIRLNPEQGWKATERRFQTQLEHRLGELKADVVERPLLYSGIAFLAGFLSNTFPARILFLFVARVVSWLSVPAILLMGILKLSDLFSSAPRRSEPTLLHKP
jgi:hypothetical protein